MKIFATKLCGWAWIDDWCLPLVWEGVLHGLLDTEPRNLPTTLSVWARFFKIAISCKSRVRSRVQNDWALTVVDTECWWGMKIHCSIRLWWIISLMNFLLGLQMPPSFHGTSELFIRTNADPNWDAPHGNTAFLHNSISVYTQNLFPHKCKMKMERTLCQ